MRVQSYPASRPGHEIGADSISTAPLLPSRRACPPGRSRSRRTPTSPRSARRSSSTWARAASRSATARGPPMPGMRAPAARARAPRRVVRGARRRGGGAGRARRRPRRGPRRGLGRGVEEGLPARSTWAASACARPGSTRRRPPARSRWCSTPGWPSGRAATRRRRSASPRSRTCSARGRARRVLDVGTGSGLLAIAARKLGAGRVAANDNDPVAVEVARENAARNGAALELTGAPARGDPGDLRRRRREHPRERPRRARAGARREARAGRRRCSSPASSRPQEDEVRRAYVAAGLEPLAGGDRRDGEWSLARARGGRRDAPADPPPAGADRRRRAGWLGPEARRYLADVLRLAPGARDRGVRRARRPVRAPSIEPGFESVLLGPREEAPPASGRDRAPRRAREGREDGPRRAEGDRARRRAGPAVRGGALGRAARAREGRGARRALAPDRRGGGAAVRARRRPRGAAPRSARARARGARAGDAGLRVPRPAEPAPPALELRRAPRRSPRWSGPRAASPTPRCAPARGPGPCRASLGPRTLRAETAAIVAVALLQARFGDLG